MQAGISDSLTHSLWLWGFGHVNIQVPGSSLYTTRWVWGHLFQQDTALYLRCRADRFINTQTAQRIKCGQSAWVTNLPTLFVFYCIIFYIWYQAYSKEIHLQTLLSEEAEDTNTVHLGNEVGIPLTNQLVDTLSTAMVVAYLAPLQPWCVHPTQNCKL